MRHTKWTSVMDRYLRNNYHLAPASEIASTLKVSKQAVLRRARNLGIEKKSLVGTAQRGSYLPQEDNYIKENIHSIGALAVAKNLERPYEGIRKRANRLGIHIGGDNGALTPEQEAILIANIQHKTYREIGLLIDRNEEAVRWHARQRGLKKRQKKINSA